MEFLTTKAAQLKLLSVNSLSGSHHDDSGDNTQEHKSVRHQHSLQVICQPPDTPDHLAPHSRPSPGQLMKAKSEGHFQLASKGGVRNNGIFNLKSDPIPSPQPRIENEKTISG